ESNPTLLLPSRTPMVFTLDGRSLVIQAARVGKQGARAGKPQLFLRSLDHPDDAKPIAGAEDAYVPFVSPNGKWVGFWSGNEIRKVPLEGGTAMKVCALNGAFGPFGAAWGRDDVIV